MNLISIENLCVSYGAKSVLHGVDLRIDAGEVVTIVGPNGSGKTSLLRSIIGAKTPQKGTIALKPGIKIGYVPQRLNFDYSLPMTVERFMKLSNNVNKRECLDALKKSGVPDIFKSQVTQLSGGQFQRVLLARAIINKPDILLLDEVLAAGDAKFFQKAKQRITSLIKDAEILIFATHEFDALKELCSRVLVMHKGQIAFDGPPAAAIDHYQQLLGMSYDAGADNSNENNSTQSC